MRKIVCVFAAAALSAVVFSGSMVAAPCLTAYSAAPSAVSFETPSMASSAVSAEAGKAPKGEIKTAVFSTNLHCAKCVTKVNENIAFEKGVKDLDVNLKEQTITVKYDASKTSVEKIAEAIRKLGYSATLKK